MITRTIQNCSWILLSVMSFPQIPSYKSDLTPCSRSDYHRNPNNSICYHYYNVSEGMTYDDASDYCAGHGGRLATVATEALLDWLNHEDVFGLVCNGSFDVWVGLREIEKNSSSERVFRWENGDTYPNAGGLWLAGNPNHAGELGCVRIETESCKLADWNCSENFKAALCEDPCDGLIYNVTENENKILNIGCMAGELINISSAIYGLPPNLYPNAKCGKNEPANCTSQQSTEKVLLECQERQNCSVMAKNTVFGDPCVGCKKYLQVFYQCIWEECFHSSDTSTKDPTFESSTTTDLPPPELTKFSVSADTTPTDATVTQQAESNSTESEDTTPTDEIVTHHVESNSTESSALLTAGEIAAVAASSSGGSTIIIIIIVFYWKRKKKQEELDQESVEQNGAAGGRRSTYYEPPPDPDDDTTAAGNQYQLPPDPVSHYYEKPPDPDLNHYETPPDPDGPDVRPPTYYEAGAGNDPNLRHSYVDYNDIHVDTVQEPGSGL